VQSVFACHSSAPGDKLDVLQWCVELEGIAGKLKLSTSSQCAMSGAGLAKMKDAGMLYV